MPDEDDEDEDKGEDDYDDDHYHHQQPHHPSFVVFYMCSLDLEWCISGSGNRKVSKIIIIIMVIIRMMTACAGSPMTCEQAGCADASGAPSKLPILPWSVRNPQLSTTQSKH